MSGEMDAPMNPVPEAAKEGPKDAAKVARRLQEAKEDCVLNLGNCNLLKIPDAIYLVLKPYPIQMCILSQNQLQKISPKFSGAFQHLKELNLSSNLLSTLPDEMKLLSELLILDISKNRFPTIPSVVFQLTKLQELQASNNVIQDVDGESLDRITSLVKVDLHRNMLSQEVMSRLTQCRCTVQTEESDTAEEPMEV